MKNILLIDNYDSFTYNLVHLVRSLGFSSIDVVRNDEIPMDKLDKYQGIILSPGPGIPSEAGQLLDFIAKVADSKKILGVCLGHQAISESFGAKLTNMDEVYHGVALPVNILQPHFLFKGLPTTFDAGRYHSWVVANDNLPADITVLATDDAGRIMAMTHKKYDICGVQFHPESVLTPMGNIIMKNWLDTI